MAEVSVHVLATCICPLNTTATIDSIRFGSTLLQYTGDNAQGRIPRQLITTQYYYL